MTSPEQIASLLSRSGPNSKISVTCRDGERGWDYICQAHVVPTAERLSHGAKTQDLRIAVHLEPSVEGSLFFGRPGFISQDFPVSGPIPSWEESQPKAR